MRFIFALLTIVLLSSLGSCREDFTFENGTGTDLRFSKDTVYLDTIFTNIGSSTYTLKVYNNSDKNIKIPNIRLENGENSNYRLMVDGMPGKSFTNVELLARDSMFVFIETTVDIQQNTADKEFLYTDRILFHSGTQNQQVELVTLVRDAIFLYPQRFVDGTTEKLPIGDQEISGFYLDENDPVNGNELHWTSEKPYVIYGYAAVGSGKTLEVEAGTAIHFHANSGLIIGNNGTLNISGTVEQPVIIQGDRLEPQYENIPGQWDMIWMAVGSSGTLENATIKNATNGLLINANRETVRLHNLQFYNCAQNGLLGRAADILGTNLVTNNCGQAGLALTYGGSYEFVHCTFANYWNRPNHTGVVIRNYDENEVYPLTKANFTNCIIYSGSNESLILQQQGSEHMFNFRFDHCLIKFTDTSNSVFGNYPYAFGDSGYFNQCLITRNNTEHAPYFQNTSRNEMMITERATSLIGYGTSQLPVSVPFDITGRGRTTYDLGAYMHVITPTE